MSRRSLWLDDGLLDRSLPLGSASFSMGGSSWRSLKSRRSQQLSVSCSKSVIVHTPHKASSQSLHSSASDASLLSSILDESSIQDMTLVDALESTVIEAQSSTLIGSGRCPKHSVHTLRRDYCTDCESARKELITTYNSTAPTETPTIYCRDRSRRSRTDVLQLWLDSSLLCVRRAAAFGGAALTHAWSVCERLSSKVTEVNVQTGNRHGGRDSSLSRCGVMTLTESSGDQPELHPNGSLCDAFRWGSRRWRHVTSRTLLTGLVLPVLLLLLLLPLLLLLSWCWFGPAGLPAVDVPEFPHPSIFSLLSSVILAGQTQKEVVATEEGDSARLLNMERSLRSLWELVEMEERRADERHGEVLQLYTDLQQQLVSSQSRGGEDGDRWLRDQQDRLQRKQMRRRDSVQQRSQASRLHQLELRLQTLAVQMEDVTWRTDAGTCPAAASSSVDGDLHLHEALLAEVATLQASLQDIRREVDGLSGCRDRGLELDASLEMVREQVRVLIFGSQLTVGGGASGAASLPESLLQWLSQQYVSGANLQASLASLERSILQKISLQLDQRGSQETVGEDVLHAGPAVPGAAVTRQNVNEIVASALRLFSQDRTGLADYALESGGGSILSTRCSQTYKTKAGLLSLFGVPLWYFSQSPRAVIQPDVHPGNCWAFSGSSGFLVIRLSMTILPTAFTLEHIPKALAPNGTLHSAPQDFSVYGLDNESQEEGKLLGSYTYDEDGDDLQTYAVTEETERAFQIIKVQVLSNWGHQDYTCIYRFRVHGTPRDG